MKSISTLLRIYLSGIPGGLGDLKRYGGKKGIGEILRCLMPSDTDLSDEAFFNKSTTMTLYMIARAMAQIANSDPVGKFTAGNIADGVVLIGINREPREPREQPVAAAISFVNHHATALIGDKIPADVHAKMEFANMKLAHALFTGSTNALACVGRGDIRMSGNAGLLDNVNRLLDRVSEYLG
ncbi:MAG: hypothetical protein LBM77_04085 [Spirochaetaceae bacterium]|nr:hypothetical protein [Spirochaetaceae bacterium]